MTDRCKELLEQAVKDFINELGGIEIRLREEVKFAEATHSSDNRWQLQFAHLRLSEVETMRESMEGFLERGGLRTAEQMKEVILKRLHSIADDLESTEVVSLSEETAPN